MDKFKIISLMRTNDFFKSLSGNHLLQLYEKFTHTLIKSNEVLFRQGDDPNNLYIILYGRMKILKEKVEGRLSRGEIGQGEIVGEFALLTKQKRSATVIAMRDTHLLALSSKDFYEFLQANPAEAQSLWRSALIRSIQSENFKTEKLSRTAPIATLAVFSNNESPILKKAVKTFCYELSGHASTLHLDEVKLMNILNIINELTPNEIELRTTAWLSEQELNYRYILYEATNNKNDWTKRSLRQADTVIIFANALDDPQLTENEINIFENIVDNKIIHLVLLHPADQIHAKGAEKWIELRPNIRCHNIREGSQQDFQRIVRIAIGKPRGLVLGGGGCKAYAHLGVYKALKELQVDVDYIGGSSGGANIGSILAQEYPVDDAIALIKEKFLKHPKGLRDFTPPLLSIYKGAQYEKRVQNSCGIDTLIENLWINFFAVASNINENCLQIFDKGLLWKAVRASSSLPGIFPPFIDNRGILFVDGGVLNNLPVDIMRTFTSNGQIIASTFELESLNNYSSTEGGVSGWALLRNKLLKNNDLVYPSIGEVIMSGCWIASDQHMKKMSAEADMTIITKGLGTSLLEFEAIDRMIEAGYVNTMEHATEILELISKKPSAYDDLHR